jgi:short chain dehydrogenase
MTPDYPKPPFPAQKQPTPGSTDAMQPRPDHGETSYRGSGKLKGMKAVITGGDSGIGRAVAIAFAREGADVLIAFLDETEEANEVKKLVENEGRKAVLVAGDLQDAKHCRGRSMVSAASTSWSTMRPTRPRSRISATSRTRNGRRPSGPTSIRCSTSQRPPCLT